jgi:hypothetical protein
MRVNALSICEYHEIIDLLGRTAAWLANDDPFNQESQFTSNPSLGLYQRMVDRPGASTAAALVHGVPSVGTRSPV